MTWRWANNLLSMTNTAVLRLYYITFLWDGPWLLTCKELLFTYVVINEGAFLLHYPFLVGTTLSPNAAFMKQQSKIHVLSNDLDQRNHGLKSRHEERHHHPALWGLLVFDRQGRHCYLGHDPWEREASRKWVLETQRPAQCMFRAGRVLHELPKNEQEREVVFDSLGPHGL